jgi:single stranded DNA-binding protein
LLGNPKLLCQFFLAATEPLAPKSDFIHQGINFLGWGHPSDYIGRSFHNLLFYRKRIAQFSTFVETILWEYFYRRKSTPKDQHIKIEITPMPNLNSVHLIGLLTRDPELRYTPSGTPVCDVSIAINRKWKDGDQQKEEATFVDVTFFARIAEIVSQYTKKGSPLFVDGRLHQDSWTDKQSGKNRTKLKVVGENVQLLGARPQNQSTSASAPQKSAVPTEEPDSIPF